MTTLDGIFQRSGRARDPVCGMEVPMDNPFGGTAEYGGVTYYFCAAGCRQAFLKDPSHFLTR